MTAAHRSSLSSRSHLLKDYSHWEQEKRVAEIIGEIDSAAQQILAWNDPRRLILQIDFMLATLLENGSALPRTIQFINAWSNSDYQDRLNALQTYQMLSIRRWSVPTDLPRRRRRARRLAYTRNWKFTRLDAGHDELHP
jgi:hypothetical protein